MTIESRRGTANAVSLARGAFAIVAGCLTTTLVATPATAQQNPVAAIVSTAPDGPLVLEYAARPGACGDGDGTLNVIHNSNHVRLNGHDVDCDPGPARVTFTIRDHAIAAIRTTVGGTRANARQVPAPAMASYLLALIPSLEGRSHELTSQALVGAVVADSSDVVPPLLAMAQDVHRERETRGSALFWTGMLGDSTVVAPIAAIATDSTQPMRLREGAVFSISQRSDEPAFQALMSLARDSHDHAIRRKALFWLGQKDDPRATALLTSLILR